MTPTIYVRTPGNRNYLRADTSLANHAFLDGISTSVGSPQYYLRHTENGRRVWELIGSDYSVALDRILDPVKLSVVAPTPKVLPVKDTPLDRDIAAYLKEVAAHKAKKTLYAYRLTLTLFREFYLGTSLQKVTREDLLGFAAWLRDIKKNAPRTVRNRLDFLRTFMLYKGVPALLKKQDRPRYTKKSVSPYSEADLTLLFNHATEDEADLLHFLIGTGSREQDAAFACWSDIDFSSKKFSITEKLDLGYRPKDREEIALPCPASLLERLRARQTRFPKVRLIFPTADGKPNGHLLRIVKRLALRSGVNCGNCYDRKGRCCSDHPTCRKAILHRFRKTYASYLHKAGIPARTVQKYLRHSELSTTLFYLASIEDAQTYATIDGAFSFGGAR